MIKYFGIFASTESFKTFFFKNSNTHIIFTFIYNSQLYFILGLCLKLINLIKKVKYIALIFYSFNFFHLKFNFKIAEKFTFFGFCREQQKNKAKIIT
jgi:hypothetical protein